MGTIEGVPILHSPNLATLVEYKKLTGRDQFPINGLYETHKVGPTSVVLASLDQMTPGQFSSLVDLHDICFPGRQVINYLQYMTRFNRGRLIAFITDPSNPDRIVSSASLMLSNQFGTLSHNPNKSLSVLQPTDAQTHPDNQQKGYHSSIISVLFGRGIQVFPSLVTQSVHQGTMIYGDTITIKPSRGESYQMKVKPEDIEQAVSNGLTTVVDTFHPYLLGTIMKVVKKNGYEFRPEQDEVLNRVINSPWAYVRVYAEKKEKGPVIKVYLQPAIPHQLDLTIDGQLISMPTRMEPERDMPEIEVEDPNLALETVVHVLQNNPIGDLETHFDQSAIDYITESRLGTPGEFNPLVFTERVCQQVLEAFPNQPITKERRFTSYRLAFRSASG